MGYGFRLKLGEWATAWATHRHPHSRQVDYIKRSLFLMPFRYGTDLGKLRYHGYAIYALCKHFHNTSKKKKKNSSQNFDNNKNPNNLK